METKTPVFTAAEQITEILQKLREENALSQIEMSLVRSMEEVAEVLTLMNY